MKRNELPTPCFVVDEAALRHNLEILAGVQKRTGAKILLAQKAFSMYRVYPLIARYLAGACASGLYEARLAHEEMGGENHVFSPAYTPEEMKELVTICDHVVFNSFSQLEQHRAACETAGVSYGIRVNPECSTQEGHAIYDPCSPFSRLGVTRANFRADLLEGVDGLHFHTLCEQNSDDLVRTFESFEQDFGEFLPRLKWLNLGGGHHITKDDYDIYAMDEILYYIRAKYPNLTIYLEPGEAIALNAGWLDTTVLDIVHNGMPILILDTSAACHMPDVLEMPYRPPLVNAGEPNEKAVTCRLAARTCLAGDVVGDYSFDRMPEVGERLTFGDMAIYSMVKTNTFNGMPLPAIALLHEDGDCELVKTFGSKTLKKDFLNMLYTLPAQDGFHMPAEFAPQDGVLLVWPVRPGSWGIDPAAAQRAFCAIMREASKSERVYLLADAAHLNEARAQAGAFATILEIPTDDSWARDIGPTFVTNGSTVRGIDWRFNAWGGAVDGLYEDYADDDAAAQVFCRAIGADCYDAGDFVLEGGSICSDGEGTLLVTEACLLSAGRNPKLTKAQIEQKLKDYLGIEKVLWLPRGIYNDETNEHVDNVCAFLRPGEVVLAWTDDETDPQFAMSQADYDYLSRETDARGRKLVIHKLPVPDHPVCVTELDMQNLPVDIGEETRTVGERLAASYVNFYFTNDAVLLPQFGGENAASDAHAVEIMRALCPECRIVPIDSRDILLGGGNIHCVTQQIPKGAKQ